LDLKELAKFQVERENLEKELTLERELIEYEKHLPSLIANKVLVLYLFCRVFLLELRSC